MRYHYLILSLALSLVFFSCGGNSGKVTGGGLSSLDSIRYASGFTVTDYDDYIVAEVGNPWDSTQVLQRYILVDRQQSLPADLPSGTVIRVPVRRIVVYSSVHVAMIDWLGESDQVIGVCESEYMHTPAIQEGLKAGRVTDLGQSTSPNVEKIIDINAELIIASPFQNSNYGGVEKLGIPIVEGADYMENSPLGRAEWIRFYSLLFDKVALGDSLFNTTATRYHALKKMTDAVVDRPLVLSEKRYGATWFVPAGASYMAQLYADAGADYVFSRTRGAGSVPLSFEAVLDQGIHADCWLFKYHEDKTLTYDDLRREYAPYAYFDAFKNKKIYASNTAKTYYYEETPIHPDYLLEDLVKIFHPELLPGYDLRYFEPLAE